MIWWRGNGLFIGFLAFFPAVAAAQLGVSRVALAYFASAVIIYLLRHAIGEISALFSIPTRFWPPVRQDVELEVIRMQGTAASSVCQIV